MRARVAALVAVVALAPALAAQQPRPRGVVALGAGADFTCALTGAGAVFCWGRNDVGQLGVGASDSAAHPEPRRVALDVAAVSLGVGYDHACATAADGSAYCWGSDRNRESGSPSRVERCADGARWVSCRTRPARVEGPTKFRFVAAGFRQSCGIAEDGSVYCWGDWTVFGTPRDSSHFRRCSASPDAGWCIPHPTAYVAVASRWYPRPPDRGTPFHVEFDTLAMGALRNCGMAKGDLYCWGHGVGADHVATGNNQRHVTSGFEHACVIGKWLNTYCWGERELGALGIGAKASGLRDRGAFIEMPGPGPPLVGDRTLSAVSAGGLHTCGIDAQTNRAMCWGANQWGQLGIGTVDRLPPATIRSANPEARFIATDARFALIAAGVDHTCGMTEAGQVLCWGRTRRGATGAVTPSAQPVPTAVRFDFGP